MDNSSIYQMIQASIDVKQQLLENTTILTCIEAITKAMINCFSCGGRVWLCGNGGSAADAQHIAAELSGRFYYDRPPLFAEALHVNTSYLTAVANDYGYNEVFARLLLAKAQAGDMLLAFSTSGNSKNVLRALEIANQQALITVGFTGKTGGQMGLNNLCTHLIPVPSNDTPRIQECHLMIGHVICALVEASLFPKKEQ